MPRLLISLSLATLLLGVSIPSFASDDDSDWITKCMKDNKKEDQAIETVMIYCHCMNEQMSDSESSSITEWEKSHPGATDACSKKAGWQ